MDDYYHSIDDYYHPINDAYHLPALSRASCTNCSAETVPSERTSGSTSMMSKASWKLSTSSICSTHSSRSCANCARAHTRTRRQRPLPTCAAESVGIAKRIETAQQTKPAHGSDKRRSKRNKRTRATRNFSFRILARSAPGVASAALPVAARAGPGASPAWSPPTCPPGRPPPAR
eukprot:7872078-Pyramimonas_sp.AAC.3